MRKHIEIHSGNGKCNQVRVILWCFYNDKNVPFKSAAKGCHTECQRRGEKEEIN